MNVYLIEFWEKCRTNHIIYACPRNTHAHTRIYTCYCTAHLQFWKFQPEQERKTYSEMVWGYVCLHLRRGSASSNWPVFNICLQRRCKQLVNFAYLASTKLIILMLNVCMQNAVQFANLWDCNTSAYLNAFLFINARVTCYFHSNVMIMIGEYMYIYILHGISYNSYIVYKLLCVALSWVV